MATQRQNLTDAPCGCYVHIDPDPGKTGIRFCLTHKAAPKMLEALKAALDYVPETGAQGLADEIRAAIA